MWVVGSLVPATELLGEAGMAVDFPSRRPVLLPSGQCQGALKENLGGQRGEQGVFVVGNATGGAENSWTYQLGRNNSKFSISVPMPFPLPGQWCEFHGNKVGANVDAYLAETGMPDTMLRWCSYARVPRSRLTHALRELINVAMGCGPWTCVAAVLD